MTTNSSTAAGHQQHSLVDRLNNDAGGGFGAQQHQFGHDGAAAAAARVGVENSTPRAGAGLSSGASSAAAVGTTGASTSSEYPRKKLC